MKRIVSVILLLTLALGLTARPKGKFVRVEGHNLVKPDGTRLFIQGTNLGNWLNPEGYMFGFSRTNSAWMIDLLFKQMVGPDVTAQFWADFKDHYITRDDILFIRDQGANTIRLPFNYKLFTDEDYMGLTAQQDGFKRIDDVVRWCREAGLYLILDMHDCPGGQTGDNIDDGHGYPWLFESEASQQLFCDIWQRIARRYRNEPVILGYELMNEPIAHYFDNREELYRHLEPLYKRAVAAIRKADYIDFRDKSGLPMYMGEFGHNTEEWQRDMVNVLKANNIGYTFWPYKKVDGSCMMGIDRPAEWDSIVVKYSEAPRGTYKEWREARPDQAKARRLLQQFIENCQIKNCHAQQKYIQSMGLK